MDNLKFEKELWKKYKYVAGVDEVGLGPFAGPIVSGCVILPKGTDIKIINDSKKLTAPQRERAAEEIYSKALFVGLGIVQSNEIDEIDYLPKATQISYLRALEDAAIEPEYILIDGDKELEIEGAKQKAIIKGDFYSQTIAAASIIAKVFRDNLMKDLDNQFENIYGWSSNKGYLSKQHIEICKEHGLTPVHRRSFRKAVNRCA